MSPPEVWGPPVWTLFHTLAEKINEEAYPQLSEKLFFMIKMICSNLPCPYCATDATLYLNKISLANLKTKQQFKDMIYLFHNYVNKKKNKKLFNYVHIPVYNKYNLIAVANNFIKVYHTRGNMQQLSESFQRQIVLKSFKKWFCENYKYFR